MKYIQSFASKFRNELLEFNLDWDELIEFLISKGYDVSKLGELNKKTNKFLAKGNSGQIYSFDRDKVLKITTDNIEYDYARKMIGKNYLHLPNIYDVKVANNKVNSLYFILMDKCKKLPNDLYNFISDYYSYILKYFVKDEMEYIEKISVEYYKKIIIKYDIKNQLLEIRKELSLLGFAKSFTLDLHDKNFMIKNGKICLIDFLIPKRYLR